LLAFARGYAAWAKRDAHLTATRASQQCTAEMGDQEPVSTCQHVQINVRTVLV